MARSDVRGVRLGSDCLGEFVERGSDSEMVVSGVGAEFVVAAPHVLDERVPANHS